MERVVVHQAVYGYRDGHRLLASSLKLPPEAARLLLVLSDRSGPTLPTDFDGYLTGTPLPDVPLYALCKTYEAPELPRPGCVYTHALLVQWADLSRLADLRVLLDLLKRPTAELREESDLEPIPVGPTAAPAAAWSSGAAALLLQELYAELEPSLVLTAESRQEWEPLLIAVWSQMWPRLRRQFRFSTGTMSFRGLARRGFDVQVVPSGAARRMQGEATHLKWVDLHAPTLLPLLPWRDLLHDDLPSVDRTSLRTFLVQHGADLEARRNLLPLLVDCYRYVAGLASTALEQLVVRVTRAFPTGAEAGRLKQTLLGAASSASAADVELPKLLCLAATPNPDAFVFDDFDLPARIRQLFVHDRTAARHLTAALAVLTPRNEHGDHLLAECAQLITARDIESFAHTHPGKLCRLLPYNVSLATHAAAWQGSTEEQTNQLRTIAQSTDVDPELLRRVLATVVQSATPQLAELTLDLFDVAAVETALERAEVAALNRGWQDALARRPAALVEWLQRQKELTPGLGLLLVGALAPWDKNLKEVSYQLWLALHERCKSSLQRAELATVQAFVLALGLQDLQGHGAEICMSTFPGVWDAVMKSYLPEAAWEKLESLTHRLNVSDKAGGSRREKLARLLIGGYVRYGWPLSDFFQTLRTPPLLEEVADSVHTFWSPSPFLHRLWVELEAGRISASDEQRRLAKKWK